MPYGLFEPPLRGKPQRPYQKKSPAKAGLEDATG